MMFEIRCQFIRKQELLVRYRTAIRPWPDGNDIYTSGYIRYLTAAIYKLIYYSKFKR